ncbi:MAG: sulfatase-like hydrolase/transferase [Planctomycetes bacterium]|nr:sulfatase-like hydrolase/transferase [Planctomycetota bacterium]
MADDLGYGDTSCYQGWIKTPNLERLAANGLTFTDFHSSGVVCSPTRAGLLTGCYQERNGVPGVINADPEHPDHVRGLDPKAITFPNLLKQQGYSTAVFGKWHLGYDKKFNPIHHGFDQFRGFISGNIDYISHYDRMEIYDWWDNMDFIVEEGYSTHLITQHAVEFIKENQDQPFCLYVAHEAVHAPYQAPTDFAQRGPNKTPATEQSKRKNNYAQMMLEMDRGIGEVMATVGECGIAENTLIFFFSDNGANSVGSNAPFKGFKGTVWEGGHRVPAIACWPGKIQPGSTSKELTISLDLMPTMLDLANATLPEGHGLDGVSLKPLLLQGIALENRKLFWRGNAMREGKWKLVKQGRSAMLYDLSNDICEANNLAEKFPNRTTDMLADLEAWRLRVRYAGYSATPLY